MSIDLDLAASFLAAHARVLDRRRFAALTPGAGAQERAGVLAALEGYRNPDGGYGWGLEPDLRAAESQPAGALHALEALADAAPETAPATGALLDWLDAATLPDGGLPFALPVADPTACAPFWVDADPATSSLQITAAVAAHAHRVAGFDDRVAAHPWLDRVTRYCLDAIAAVDDRPAAHVLSFSLQFLDAVADTRPEVPDLLARLRTYVPADGALAVEGGAEGETLRLLDVSPRPGGQVRALLGDAAVIRDLDRLAGGQQADGGWAVDFASASAAAALEWRGHGTVAAVATLRANGRIPATT